MVIGGLEPRLRLIGIEGLPEATGLLLTLMLAAGSATVGVIVRLETEFATDSV